MWCVECGEGPSWWLHSIPDAGRFSSSNLFMCVFLWLERRPPDACGWGFKCVYICSEIATVPLCVATLMFGLSALLWVEWEGLCLKLQRRPGNNAWAAIMIHDSCSHGWGFKSEHRARGQGLSPIPHCTVSSTACCSCCGCAEEFVQGGC